MWQLAEQCWRSLCVAGSNLCWSLEQLKLAESTHRHPARTEQNNQVASYLDLMISPSQQHVFPGLDGLIQKPWSPAARMPAANLLFGCSSWFFLRILFFNWITTSDIDVRWLLEFTAHSQIWVGPAHIPRHRREMTLVVDNSPPNVWRRWYICLVASSWVYSLEKYALVKVTLWV